MIANTTTADKPLLRGKGLPPFEMIEADAVVPEMTQLLEKLDAELASLEANVQPTWEGLVEPLQLLEERLTWSWGIVNHLMGVKNSSELRKAHETVQPKVVQFINKLNQSQAIYKGFKALRESSEWENLEPWKSELWKRRSEMPNFPVSVLKAKNGIVLMRFNWNWQNFRLSFPIMFWMPQKPLV